MPSSPPIPPRVTTKPLTKPKSRAGKARAMITWLAAPIEASPTPMSTRDARAASNPPIAAKTPVPSATSRMQPVSTGRAPMRSSAAPNGICAAIEAKNIAETSPPTVAAPSAKRSIRMGVNTLPLARWNWPSAKIATQTNKTAI